MNAALLKFDDLLSTDVDEMGRHRSFHTMISKMDDPLEQLNDRCDEFIGLHEQTRQLQVEHSSQIHQVCETVDEFCSLYFVVGIQTDHRSTCKAFKKSSRTA